MPHHLYKRPGSSSWWIDIKVKGRRRIRRSAGTPDKAKAKALAARIEATEWKRLIDGDPASLTFAEAVMDYVADGRSERFLAPLVKHFKDDRLAAIKPGHIRAAAMAIYPKARPATWNRQVIVPARAVINHAASKGLASPIKVEIFPAHRAIRRAPEAHWLPAFMAAAPPRLAALALFLRITGARIGQALALEWSAIDLASGTATIEAARKGRGFPERVAELTPQMVALLANLPGSRQGPVFGYKRRGSGLYKAWAKTCKKAGIAYVTTHPAGRKGFFTTMHRAGVDPKTASAKGGLASVRLALEVYTEEDRRSGLITEVFGTIESQPVPEIQKKASGDNSL